MSEHPYAGPNTITPGETAADDPYSNKEYCKECGNYMKPTRSGDCPTCGKDLR